MKFIICALLSYAIGNLNCATIISTKLKKQDIREFGSGNAGTTNMLRTFGKKLGAITLIGDLLKGVLAVLICRVIGIGQSSSAYAAVGGFFVVVGHVWPALYGFRGGKGAATTLGVMLAISPFLGLIGTAVGLLSLVITKKMSVASLLGIIIVSIVGVITAQAPIKLMLIGLFAIIIFSHRENIKRLLSGTENPTFVSKEKRDLK